MSSIYFFPYIMLLSNISRKLNWRLYADEIPDYSETLVYLKGIELSMRDSNIPVSRFRKVSSYKN